VRAEAVYRFSGERHEATVPQAIGGAGDGFAVGMFGVDSNHFGP
jgi:hypothetical protein